MIPNITRGNSFAGALRYDLVKEKGYLIDTNCASNDANGIAVEMDVIAAASKSKKTVHHVSLRCPPGEMLTDSQWKEICSKYLKKMGFSTNQYAATRHFDKADGDHIHIVINRVQSNSKITNDFQEKKRSQQACREIEVEMGLQQLETHQNSASGRMLGVKTSLFQSIYESHGKTTNELKASLINRGYELILHIQSSGRIQGASIKSIEDGKTWKLSELIKGGYKGLVNQLENRSIETVHHRQSNRMSLITSAHTTTKRIVNSSTTSITDGMIEGADKDTADYLIYLKKQQDSKINLER